MFMRLNVICELQQRWKDIEHHNKFRQNDPNRLFYRKYVNLMHTIHVPSPFIAMKKVEIPTIGTVAVLTDSLTKRIKIMETMYKLGSVQIYNIHQANYDLYIQSKYIGKTKIDNTTIDLKTFLMNEIEQVNIFHQHITTIWQVQIAKSIQKLDKHNTKTYILLCIQLCKNILQTIITEISNRIQNIFEICYNDDDTYYSYGRFNIQCNIIPSPVRTNEDEGSISTYELKPDEDECKSSIQSFLNMLHKIFNDEMSFIKEIPNSCNNLIFEKNDENSGERNNQDITLPVSSTVHINVETIIQNMFENISTRIQISYTKIHQHLKLLQEYHTDVPLTNADRHAIALQWIDSFEKDNDNNVVVVDKLQQIIAKPLDKLPAKLDAIDRISHKAAKSIPAYVILSSLIQIDFKLYLNTYLQSSRKLKNTICHTLFNTAVIHVRKILGQYKMIIQYLKQQINNAVELQACVEYLANLPTNMLELDMEYKEAMIVFNMIDRLNRIQQYAPLFYKQEDSDRSSNSNNNNSSSSDDIHRIKESVSRMSISIYMHLRRNK